MEELVVDPTSWPMGGVVKQCWTSSDRRVWEAGCLLRRTR